MERDGKTTVSFNFRGKRRILLANEKGKTKRRLKNSKADEEEIMNYLRSILRGEPDEDGRTADTKTRLKAAELLAKRYGLLSETKETPALSLKVVFDYGDSEVKKSENEDHQTTV